MFRILNVLGHVIFWISYRLNGIKKLSTVKRGNERVIRSWRNFLRWPISKIIRQERCEISGQTRSVGKERTKGRKRAFRLARLCNFTVSPAVFTRPVKKKKKNIREMDMRRDSLLCSDGEFFRIGKDKRADRFHATFTQPRAVMDTWLATLHAFLTVHRPTILLPNRQDARFRTFGLSFFFFLFRHRSFLSFSSSRRVKENRFVRV